MTSIIFTTYQDFINIQILFMMYITLKKLNKSSQRKGF